MKYAFLLVIGIILVGCGTRVPYTSQIKDEFGLDTDKQMAKVQFFTSATIILEKNKRSGNQTTDDDGALVSSSNTNQDRIIIPNGTKCVFDSYGQNQELVLRFETGQGKTISFAMREGSTSGKFYLVANWNGGSKGGDISYGNDMYTATTASATAYLQVIRKKLQKTKRKDRVVKGMKV
ncbi:MAG: hypothetical protein MK105_05295 [Crocinitomicaceae bacterium]|nr:hypothetical protein [Crocinitomicaceae bacterium]